MNIDWELIEKKYRKAYHIFYHNNLEKFYNNSKFCFCDLEKFFDNNEIIILIDFFPHMKNNKWSFRIYNISDLLYIQEKMILTRDEAKEQAIIKAFEIFNK